jgi:glycosyltransferase involved in cell wall biosynthesis
MNLYLDGGFFRGAGIGRYYETLLDRLLRRDEIDAIHTVVPATRKAEFLRKYSSEKKLRAEFAGFSYFSAKEFLLLGGMLKRYEASGVRIFHFPHVNVPFFAPENLVVTIHDLRPLTAYNDLGSLLGAGYRLATRRALRKARTVIAVSGVVRDELREMFPYTREKVTTIHNFLSDRFLAGEHLEVKRLIEGDYILFVGNRMDHKNLAGLIRGFCLLRQRVPGIKLVIAGRKTKSFDAVDELRKTNGPDAGGLVEYHSIDDESLLSLYKYAKALALVSFYEGFGYPPLEAMALGTPAVVSDIPIFRELYQGAAVFVNPEVPGDIAEGMEKILRNVEERQVLVQSGYHVAKRFNGNEQIDEIIRCYSRLAGQLQYLP